MNPFKPTLFILFTTFILTAGNIQLDFPYFTTTNTATNITFIGDSSLRNRFVSLTKSTTFSTGSIIYNKPISLFDILTNTTSSFSTMFSFSITNPNNPTSFGDGIAFFLSPNNLSSLSSSSSASTFGLPTNFVAVEFDTRFDRRFNDPNENHIGFNIDTLNSMKIVDPIYNGIDLKSGNTITSWIDYKTDVNSLSVFLSYSPIKPRDPILFVTVDLSEYFRGNDGVYVGFSASAEKSTELHQIQSWSFYTVGFEPARPRLRSHNVSDNSVSVSTGNEVHVNASRPHSRSHSFSSKKRFGLGFAVAGPVFFCVVFSLLGYYSFMKWKGVRKCTLKNFGTGFVAYPREFNYRELKSATREFHPSRIVGHGSFGTVYKAFFISSGTIAAVKRSRHSHEGKAEFHSELSIIAGLRHKNLVQLLGWCVEKGELLLVYDFMPNGSLDKMLYKEPERGKLLSWSHRVNIVVGLASVLVYLHQECEQRVIHRDIKTANVLLDGNFNPRLGDFGLAKLMDHDKSPVSTLTAGTMGYLAPEYLQYGKATDKTDVFSYGVVVLEVACGKRPIEREGTKMVNLVDWVWGLYSEGKIIEAVDKRLNGEFEEEEMKKVLMLGLSCANPDSAERPTMRRVLQILNNEAVPFTVPKVKPCLTFSSDLPLTIDEIVSDVDDGEGEEFNTSQSMCEIKIEG